MDEAKTYGVEVEVPFYIHNRGKWTLGDFEVKTHPWVEAIIPNLKLKPGLLTTCILKFDAQKHFDETGNYRIPFIVYATDPTFVMSPHPKVVEELEKGIRKWSDLSEDERKVVTLHRQEEALKFDNFMERDSEREKKAAELVAPKIAEENRKFKEKVKGLHKSKVISTKELHQIGTKTPAKPKVDDVAFKEKVKGLCKGKLVSSEELRDSPFGKWIKEGYLIFTLKEVEQLEPDISAAQKMNLAELIWAGNDPDTGERCFAVKLPKKKRKKREKRSKPK